MLLQFTSFVSHRSVAKYWESIAEKLKSDGWEVRWVEAMHDAEPGWTATAIRGKDRHSTHANDITLAFQELEASCLIPNKSGATSVTETTTSANKGRRGRISRR